MDLILIFKHSCSSRAVRNFKKASVVCFEYVDWNVGKFAGTGGYVAEDLGSVVPAISFRPTAQTVFRLNYCYQQQKDILGNPPIKTRGLSFGISTYF